jgi:hypothetical protein
MAGMHDQQREPPHVLAAQRQRATDDLALVLGDPGAAGVGPHGVQVAEPNQLQGGRRLDGVAEAAVEVLERRDVERVDGGHVVLVHRAELRHRRQD